jgi:hypothetical protein
MLLIMVFLFRDNGQSGVEIAGPEPVPPPQGQPVGPEGQSPRIAEGPEDSVNESGPDSMIADAPRPAPKDLGPMPPVASPLTLVSSVRRTKLVLVYEVAVTEEGVEKAAFSNLLRRHRIGFNATMPVSGQQQADLLRHRFLENVKVADERFDQMDRVDLYLVKTTALTADALYADLLSKPAGFGAFALNLTSRDAHSRVLNRLCEASEAEGHVGEAVRLLANFGILSRSARSVGAFGTLRWVDPTLYEVPAPSKREPDSTGADTPDVDVQVAEVRQPEQAPRDFDCELLFVVRQWGVTPDAPSAGQGNE